MKKVLLVDDSALMRMVLCDIINADGRFRVVDRAKNGAEALELLKKNEYDVVVLDVNMPVMNGLELLKNLRSLKIRARVVMASTDTADGTKTTLEALELGAIDFVHKPDNPIECRDGTFKNKLINILSCVCESKVEAFVEKEDASLNKSDTSKLVELARKSSGGIGAKQIVCIASSTGGPKALHEVVSGIPKEINAPVVIVQHMPKGFTKSLAERLDTLTECEVSEAEDGDKLEKGHIYIARGGSHLNIDSFGKDLRIKYTDEPPREGVKPCANYMFESVGQTNVERVVCVVLTGMGADGTQGIENLKKLKKTYVITQDEATSTVYGMPKACAKAGLSDITVPLKSVAQELIMNVGVN